ncbi:MAG TPA: NYN domain-containing protein [Bacillota bacterium]|nr:NYN domain-containing protein [Bacillota bacterium]
MTEPALQNGKCMNAVVFVDYENIYELLKQYGKDPVEVNFFKIIPGKLKESNLKIIDFIIYNNIEKKLLSNRQQMFLQNLGFKIRHVVSSSKNSSCLKLAIDALQVLYENSRVNVFVIISNEWNLIPLMEVFKNENRFSYVVSTKNGCNKSVAEYADFHQDLEEIFNLTQAAKVGKEPANLYDLTGNFPGMKSDTILKTG